MRGGSLSNDEAICKQGSPRSKESTMNLRFLALLAVFASVHCTMRASEEETPKPSGWKDHILHPFGLGKAKEAKEDPKAPSWKRLYVSLAVEPTPLKLTELRSMKVLLKLENKSSKFVQLEFPTSQRIEVLVKGADGTMIEHWSEDQAFTQEVGLVTINPGERIEYTASVATRSLKPGETYTIEGFFPSYDQLRAVKTVVAEN